MNIVDNDQQFESFRVLIEYGSKSRFVRVYDSDKYADLRTAIMDKFSIKTDLEIEIVMISGFGDSANAVGIADDDDVNEIIVEIRGSTFDKLVVSVMEQQDVQRDNIEDQVLGILHSKKDPDFYKDLARRQREHGHAGNGGLRAFPLRDHMKGYNDYHMKGYNEYIKSSQSVPVEKEKKELRVHRADSAPAPPVHQCDDNHVKVDRTAFVRDDISIHSHRDSISARSRDHGLDRSIHSHRDGIAARDREHGLDRSIPSHRDGILARDRDSGLDRSRHGISDRASGRDRDDRMRRSQCDTSERVSSRGRRGRGRRRHIDRGYDQSARINDYDYEERNYFDRVLPQHERSRSYSGYSGGISDRLFHVKALEIDIKFNGDDDKYHEFKKQLNYHVNINELRSLEAMLLNIYG